MDGNIARVNKTFVPLNYLLSFRQFVGRNVHEFVNNMKALHSLQNVDANITATAVTTVISKLDLTALLPVCNQIFQINLLSYIR